MVSALSFSIRKPCIHQGPPRTSAFDKNTQSDKPLTSEELELIRRLYENEVPDAEYDPYEPTVEWFTGKGKEEVMPISAAPRVRASTRPPIRTDTSSRITIAFFR